VEGGVGEVRGKALNTNVVNGRVLFQCEREGGAPVLTPVEHIRKVPKGPAPKPPMAVTANAGYDVDASEGVKPP